MSRSGSAYSKSTSHLSHNVTDDNNDTMNNTSAPTTLRRSYSLAPVDSTVNDLSNLTVEQLQKEIKRLRHEMEMWRHAAGQRDDPDVAMTTARFKKYSKSAGQHKPNGKYTKSKSTKSKA